jgi:hypothetical protein
MNQVEIVFRPIDRWPQEPTPAAKQKGAAFRAAYNKTLKLLEYELARLGVKRAFLQVDVAERDIRADGQMRLDARPRSPRVIVSANTKHGPITMPCDTFNDWQDNVRAIALALEALRAVDRYGVTRRGEQYRGLKQLTAGDGPLNSQEAAAFIAKHCHPSATPAHRASEILGSSNVFEQCYRAAAKAIHPDAGGDRREWDKLQLSAAILRDHFGAKA